MTRQNHYLKQIGYTPQQLIAFERERMAVIAACAIRPRTRDEIGNIIGIYQAMKVLEDLRLDGYIIRYIYKPTGETRYKLNQQAFSKDAFFLESGLK